MAESEPSFNFESIRAQIAAIRNTFRSPSISLGVLHHGKVILTHSEGLADIEAGRAADADTVYAIASCSKAFSSATIAKLVDEGRLDWRAPVGATYLPDFARTPADPEIGRRATLVDICSHGTGLAPTDHATMGFHDTWYHSGAAQVNTAAHLPAAYDFRSRFLYNNSVFGLAGVVIESAFGGRDGDGGRTLGQIMKDKIFDPLGLARTCTTTAGQPDDGNVAKGYTILDDGTPLCRGYIEFEESDPQAAAGCVRSTVNDMLRWAAAVMEAEALACRGDKSAVLPGIELTRAAHRPLTDEFWPGENSYGMGWFRHTFPSRMLGCIGPNYNGRLYGDDPPLINRAGPPVLAIAHYGEYQGFLASFYTLPATRSAVVVLANSAMLRGDPTDLVAQAIIQELLDMKPRVPLETFAERAAARADETWPMLVRQAERTRVRGTARPPVSDYVGRYRHEGLQLTIEVFEAEDAAMAGAGGGKDDERALLAFRVNGLEQQTARLRHFHYDTWTWMPGSRDEAARAGVELYLKLEWLLLSFVREVDGKVTAVEWDLQAGELEGPGPGLDKLVKPFRFERCEG